MRKAVVFAAVAALAIAAAGTAWAVPINTSALSQNGWFSDDTRADTADAGVPLAVGDNLVSPTLTDNPEATASGNAAHDPYIQGQIQFGDAPPTVPAGTHMGAVHLAIAPGCNPGKSTISHRKDDAEGHGDGTAFGQSLQVEYHWMGDGTTAITASLKLGLKTSDFGSTGTSTRTGENVWDKILIYEPGDGNGGVSDGLWHTETVTFDTGKWWLFDRTNGVSNISNPMTLSTMESSMQTFGGGRSFADLYDLISNPSTKITSVQLGIGSWNAGGSVYVNQLETSFYREGDTTTFGTPIPEPATLTLLGLGLACAAWRRRRR